MNRGVGGGGGTCGQSIKFTSVQGSRYPPNLYNSIISCGKGVGISCRRGHLRLLFYHRSPNDGRGDPYKFYVADRFANVQMSSYHRVKLRLRLRERERVGERASEPRTGRLTLILFREE